MKKIFWILVVALAGIITVGCMTEDTSQISIPPSTEAYVEELCDDVQQKDIVEQEETESVEEFKDVSVEAEIETEAGSLNISDIPAYSGTAYAVINGNVPFFTDDQITATSYEYYSPLDSLGRCGVCVASVGQDIMPTEERGSIGSIKPTGWHTVKYAGIVNGNYLYNRCHLIAYELTGENTNTSNLITGTRYMNVDGMLPFENMVADYVIETGNHVMYRATPVFEGDNLLATGVLIEAKSVEDNGNGILFNVFCYNVQPGIMIDYATGDSSEDGTVVVEEQSQSTGNYAVNAKNGKIHIVGKCSATQGGSNAMKNPVYFDTYDEAEAYSAKIAPSQDKRKCGNCESQNVHTFP